MKYYKNVNRKRKIKIDINRIFYIILQLTYKNIVNIL